MEKFIQYILTVIVNVLTFGIASLWQSIKNHQNKVVVAAAEYVEKYYNAQNSLEKKEMFIDICKRTGKVSVAYADKYLESVIMPISRKINKIIPVVSNKKRGVDVL